LDFAAGVALLLLNYRHSEVYMFGNWMQRTGKFLIELGDKPRARKPSKRPAMEASRNIEFDQRARKVVGERQKSSGKILAGAIQLLGMDDIKKAMGNDWKAVASRAHDIAERIIRSQLSDADAYDRRNGDTYILCFAKLSKAEAEQKTNEIVVAIKKQLAEQVPEAPGIHVDHQVSEIEWAEDLGDDASIFDVLAESLQRIREETAQAAKRWRRVLLEESRVVFRPLWPSKRQALPIFCCLLDSVSGKTALARVSSASSSDELLDTMSELDCAILGRAVEGFHSFRQNDGACSIIVPVTFHTVNDRQRRGRFVALWDNIPEAYRQSICLEFHSIHPGVPNVRLIEVIQYLRPLCGGIILQTPADEQRIRQMSGTGLFGIALDAAWLSQFGVQPTLYLSRFVKLATVNKLRTIAHGLNTTGMFEAARKAGFDYLAGDAVAPPIAALRRTPAWLLRHTGS
jgi:hypothetical protein